MITKPLFSLCLGCGLALSLSGCGKPKNDPPVAVMPSTTTTNSPPAPTFESEFARARSLYDQGKYSEAQDVVESLKGSLKPSGLVQHTELAHFKGEILKAVHGSKTKGKDGQNP